MSAPRGKMIEVMVERSDASSHPARLPQGRAHPARPLPLGRPACRAPSGAGMLLGERLRQLCGRQVVTSFAARDLGES